MSLDKSFLGENIDILLSSGSFFLVKEMMTCFLIVPFERS